MKSTDWTKNTALQPCNIYVDKETTLIGVSMLTSWDHDLLHHIRDQFFLIWSRSDVIGQVRNHVMIRGIH